MPQARGSLPPPRFSASAFTAAFLRAETNPLEFIWVSTARWGPEVVCGNARGAGSPAGGAGLRALFLSVWGAAALCWRSKNNLGAFLFPSLFWNIFHRKTIVSGLKRFKNSPVQPSEPTPFVGA